MEKISLDKYKEIVKEERKIYFKQPYDLVYDNFVKLGYDKISKEFFCENASEIVENLRNVCWKEYEPLEKKFTSNMLKKLINKQNFEKYTSYEAINWFIEEFPEHMYVLSLSNTQSRRSRAGKEFESIIELILIGAGVSLDSQGNIGKQEFLNKGLGKLVDLVSPGVLEYIINKRDTVLISAKTTLRERWQEVPEEMIRTGAREMFLATLDTSISDDVLNTLYEANIQITTTKDIKSKFYANNHRVLTFEKLIKICLDNVKHWEKFSYTNEQKEQIIELIEKQIEKHENRRFIIEYYNERLEDIKKDINDE